MTDDIKINPASTPEYPDSSPSLMDLESELERMIRDYFHAVDLHEGAAEDCMPCTEAAKYAARQIWFSSVETLRMYQFKEEYQKTNDWQAKEKAEMLARKKGIDNFVM